MTGPGTDWLAKGRWQRRLIVGVVVVLVTLAVAAMVHAFVTPEQLPDGRLARRGWRLVIGLALPLGLGAGWLTNGVLRMRAARRAFDEDEARRARGM